LVVLAVYGGLAPLLVGLVQQVPGANALAAAGFVLIVGCTWGYGQLLRSMHRRGIVDLVRNRRALLEESLVRYDAGYVRARMAAELRRKHGWLWWLRERDARMDGA